MIESSGRTELGELFNLEGHVALVTGASRGLGWEMATALAETGADVVIGSRNEESITNAAERISKASGRKAIGCTLDVTKRGSVEAIIGRTIEEFGKIDILINNAGINIRAPIGDISDDDWNLIQQVNVTGVFYCCRAVSRHMVRSGYGRSINVGSALSLVGLPDRFSYTASKGAVVQMTRTLAVELAEAGVTVNCICPGPFATEINRPVMEDAEATASLLQNVPMKLWGRMEEIRAPVVFLASPAASYVTGAILTVDGGWTAR
jgi:NAD(P)-dependent dehydrogenase (short-subunit alcohol dehydrogenase family)